MTEDKKRLGYIDCAKFIGIFLLLVEHTGNWADISGHAYDTLKIWICSFHMPLFFIIYGMVASRKERNGKGEWLQFLDGKIKSLIIPYILWAMIYAKNINIEFLVGLGYGSNPSLQYAGTNAVLWFLPVMFLSCCMYQLSVILEKKFANKIKIVVIAQVIIPILLSYVGSVFGSRLSYRIPWGFDLAFMGFSFMMLGRYVIKPVFDRVIERNSKVQLLLMAMACFLIGGIMAYINRPTNNVYGVGVNVMALGVYGRSIILFVLTALINTFGVILISSVISNRVFEYMGKSSLVIMALHYIIFPYSIWICGRLLNNMITIHGFGVMYTLLNAVIVVAVCVLPVWLVNRYAKILNGK